MTVERWTPPGPRGSNGSRFHGVLEYRPSLYHISPFVFVFAVWLWEFSISYKEYASFKHQNERSRKTRTGLGSRLSQFLLCFRWSFLNLYWNPTDFSSHFCWFLLKSNLQSPALKTAKYLVAFLKATAFVKTTDTWLNGGMPMAYDHRQG